jgi:hypothetical protein
MNALFKPALIGALLILAGAAQYFAYAAYVSPRQRAATDLQALTDVLQLEAKRKPSLHASENRGTTIPDLLSLVQELAAQSAVTLVGVEPLPGDNEQFKLKLIAGYGDFLEFFARFEALQVEINGFGAEPAKDAPGSLEISLNFSHTAAANMVRPERVKMFSVRLKDAALRDPFNSGSAAIKIVADSNPDDLSRTFHLTSISEIGKTKYATIDGKDYNVGDALQGFVIGAIGNNNVTLVDREDGKERRRYVTFRNLPKDRT